MMTLEQVRATLADRNLSEVSRRTGIPYMVVYKCATGRVSPKYETVVALSDYLEGKPE